MEQQRNILLATVLSILVLVIWQSFFMPPPPPPVEQSTQEQTVGTPTLSANQVPASNPFLDREAIIKPAGRVSIKSNKLRGSLNLNGARIDDLILSKYKTSLEEDAEDVVLLSPSGSEEVYFAEFGWLATEGSNIQVPTKETIWYSNSKILTPTQPITLSWDNNNGLKFQITIALDDEYLFTIKQHVENYGEQSASLLPYGLINRNLHKHGEGFYILHEGLLGVFDGILTELRYDDLKEDALDNNQTTRKEQFLQSKGWLGITDKYWLTALIPDQSNLFDSHFSYQRYQGQDRYQTDYVSPSITLKPGTKHESTQHFFAGAKKVQLLDAYGKALGIELFDRAVDFGWLYIITKPIFSLLTWLNSLVGNFGLAILALTVLLKLALFPLAKKSFVSMHALKKLQPEMTRIRESTKGDHARMQKEMMELYKREKVNPASGCLPILIQIPIFFALYKVLFVTIEMRHAGFYGWVDDLSAKDPTSLFNLFGLLPWEVPALLMIGAWPILMGISMVIQQKLNPAPTDPVQAKVMKMLPYIFAIFCAQFPVGLVIYWTWSNVLSILQQWLITRNLK